MYAKVNNDPSCVFFTVWMTGCQLPMQIQVYWLWACSRQLGARKRWTLRWACGRCRSTRWRQGRRSVGRTENDERWECSRCWWRPGTSRAPGRLTSRSRSCSYSHGNCRRRCMRSQPFPNVTQSHSTALRLKDPLVRYRRNTHVEVKCPSCHGFCGGMFAKAPSTFTCLWTSKFSPIVWRILLVCHVWESARWYIPWSPLWWPRCFNNEEFRTSCMWIVIFYVMALTSFENDLGFILLLSWF